MPACLCFGRQNQLYRYSESLKQIYFIKFIRHIYSDCWIDGKTKLWDSANHLIIHAIVISNSLPVRISKCDD